MPTIPMQQDRRPPGPGGTVGAVRETRHYYDRSGTRHTARDPVPVDQYGALASARVRCPKCKIPRWEPLATLNKGGPPACQIHDLRMVEIPIPAAPFLPWSTILAGLRPYAWPVAGLALTAAAGAGAARSTTPPPVWVVVGLALAWAAARAVRNRLTNRARARGRLDVDEDTGRRTRDLIARRGRTAGYATVAASAWVAVAAQLGTDPHTLPGRIVWTVLPALWLPYAATYWRWIRRTRERWETKPEPAPPAEPDGIPLDPDEAWVRWRFDHWVAAEKDKPIPAPPTSGGSS